MSASIFADDNKELVGVEVSLEQAASIARQQVEGTVISAEAESEDGKSVWEVEILDADGTVYEVEIDASNGTVLEVEVDD
ncbi:hypothetical protein AB833_26240 [Chromatiales bacterium (ex Bugula neritina AB1)]|nr:hypothetical protein AB833_26240 [Chromatiales bacterium (ex Bugula neritina AB1)]